MLISYDEIEFNRIRQKYQNALKESGHNFHNATAGINRIAHLMGSVWNFLLSKKQS